MGSVTYPVSIGGTISAFDSDSISDEINVSGLPLGTRVYNESLDKTFVLKLSTASLVTDQVLEVLGIVGARWIVDDTLSAPVTNADLSPMAARTYKGNATNGSTVPTDLTILDPWYDLQAAFLLSKVPALTQFAPQKLGQYSLGTILAATGFANAGNMVGGSISAPAGSYTTLGGPIYQDIRNPFAFAFRGIIAVTITAKAAVLGLINIGASNIVGVQSAFDIDATHYVLSCQALPASVGTIVNDGLEHTFAVTGPGGGGAIKMWVDGVDSGASITQASAGAEALAGCILNTTAGNAQASKFIYGWV